jgi:hypothetical protein
MPLIMAALDRVGLAGLSLGSLASESDASWKVDWSTLPYGASLPRGRPFAARDRHRSGSQQTVASFER